MTLEQAPTWATPSFFQLGTIRLSKLNQIKDEIKSWIALDVCCDHVFSTSRSCYWLETILRNLNQFCNCEVLKAMNHSKKKYKVPGHLILCNFNRCHFNLWQFQPIAFSTYCNFDLNHSWLIGPIVSYFSWRFSISCIYKIKYTIFLPSL